VGVKYINLNTFYARGILAGTRTQLMMPFKKRVKAGERFQYAPGDVIRAREVWRAVYTPGRLSLPEQEGIVYRADNKFVSCSIKRYWDGNPKWREAKYLYQKYIRLNLTVTNAEFLYLKDITSEHMKLQGLTGKNRTIQFVNYWNYTYGRSRAYRLDPPVVAYTFEVSEV